MAPEKILIVDDEDLTRWALREKLSHWGYQAVEADRGTGAIEAADREFPDLILLDIRLPDRSGLEVLQIIKNKDPSVAVIVMTANGVLEDAVAALRLGAYDFVSKPIHFDTLSTTISTALKAAKRQREECHSPPRRPRGFDFRKIVGRSRGVSEAIELVKKVSITPTTPILIQGETGTGKELFAKAIHDHSIQAGRPLLMVNCAAVPERVLETELFGYEKDAFTEACGPKPGLFELIGGGTLVLDEISEVKPRLQAKLLRILEEHAFKRVGGVQDIPLELRLIASSSRNLNILTARGEFRHDLLYRLNVIQIKLPPLRERGDDVKLLARHYVTYFNKKFRKATEGLTPEAEALLTRYDWPGNVRELKNLIERVMLLEEGPFIGKAALPIQPTRSAPPVPVLPAISIPNEGTSLARVQEELVRQALARARGNQTHAARLLDISRDSLRYKMRKFHLQEQVHL